MSVIHIPSKPEPVECDLISAREQLGLYQKAINGRYKLPETTREGIFAFCASVVANADMPVRSRQNSAKVLLSLASLESQEERSVVEATLRYEISGMIAGGDGGLAHLQPPAEGESWTDDTPVASVVQGGEHEGS